MQNEKVKMQIKQNTISSRLMDFSVNIINLTILLEKTYTGRHVSGQLMRSATSAGANYEEACGGESRADFIHKLQIVLKEIKESLFWLNLIQKSRLAPKPNDDLVRLHREAMELTNIIAKSIVTAKK